MMTTRLLLLLLSTTGCAGQMGDPLVSVGTYRGVRVLLTNTREAARTLCAATGVDVVRAEGREFFSGGPFGARVTGCYLYPPRDVMICAAGDLRCLGHEYAHAREGMHHD